MKINYFRLSATSLLAVVLGASAQAQTGIGTTSPRTTLDVNGAIAVAEGLAAVSGNAATIPTGFSLVRLTGTATGPIVLTAATSPVVVAGQLLTINNPTAYAATFSGQLISAGQSLSLVYSNSSWQGTAGGGNTALTASNGLTRTGNDFTLGGALTGSTNITQGGNGLTLTGTGTLIKLSGDPAANTAIVLGRTGEDGLIAVAGGSGQYFGSAVAGDVTLRAANASNLIVGTTGTGALLLGSNNAERLRITSVGNVGIGTSAPSQKLDVTGGNIKIATAGNGLIFPDGSLQTTAATSGDLLTANNGLSRSGNNFTLGGALTGSTNIPLGNNNLILSTGTTGTGVLVLDGQGGGINNNTAKQRIEFTSSSDPNAVIGHTVVAGTNEINDLYMYSGNDTDAGAGPDRIRLVGENILFQNFNNAGISTVANAEANTGTITNMFIGGNGNVGIGTSAPATRLQVVSGDNTFGTNIIDAQANNQTYGTSLYYGGVRTTGSSANNALNLDGKGTGGLVLQGNGGTGDVTVGTNLGVNGNMNANSLYARGNTGISGQGAFLQWNRTGGEGETWLINQPGGGINGPNNGIRFGTSDTNNSVTEFARFVGNGSLGLGTTAPSQKLDVTGGNIKISTLGSGLIFPDGTFQTTSATNQGDNLGNHTATQALNLNGNQVLNTGNVGIGMGSPNAQLQLSNTIVNRKIVLYDGSNNDNQFYGLGINGGMLRYQVDGTGANHAFYAGTSATASQELMRIQGNGNVGIGTSAPGTKLQVVSADNNFGTNIIDAQANNQTQGVGLYYGGVRSTGSNPSVDLNLDSKGSGGLNLQRNGGGGNVTVGTNLTVNGNAQVNNYLGVNGDVGVGGNLNANSLYARANTGISGQGAYLQWNRSGGDGETWLINQQGGGGGNAGIRFGRSDASNNLTEFARFSNNGNFSVASGNKGITLDPTSNGSDVLLSLRSASTGNWARIGSNGSPLAFITQGSDAGGGAAMTINNDGTVGIGLTSPAATLDVNGSTIVRNGLHISSNGGPTLDITTTTAAVSSVPAFNNVVYDVGGWENHIFGGHVVPRDDNSMNLGIPQSRWATVYAVNGTIQTSDGRLKTNIVNSGYGLGTVMKMRPVTYNWKTAPTSNPMVGFIAQEMETLVPEAVDVPKTAAEHYGMKYNQLIPVLTKAIQEQQAQIEILTAANAGLKAELSGKASASTVNELQAALQSLRAELQAQSANHTTARAK